MRILHTSDWHLGRQFHGQSLEADHAEILSQVVQAMQEHQPDVLIIAGDIFDRAVPPTSAIRQFNDFIKGIAAETSSAIVMIAGNHDSGDRIESMSVMTDQKRALIRGPMMVDELPLILEDDEGPVAFSALPFGYEYAARDCFGDDSIASPEDVLKAQLQAAKRYVPDDARWVVTAHAFVAGASSSESERGLGRAVGGIETASADIFEGAHYVALGHLHKPQAVVYDHIRYSGSPLAFGYDEAGGLKSMSLVDLSADGSASVTEIPFMPIRKLRVLRGKLADLLASATSSDDFVKVVLTDDGMLLDPMKQIREHYPNATSLVYERDEVPLETKSASAVQATLYHPEQVVSEFLAQVRGEVIKAEEEPIVASLLKEFNTEGEGDASD